MELSELIRFYKNNIKPILVFTLAGMILGALLYYFLPQRFQAVGSLFVHRETEKSGGEYFTYEGYYGQQTAQSYTNTIIGLLESTDLKRDALYSLGSPVTEEALRKISRQIKIKKASPQLITLTLKAETPENAENLWNFFSSRTIEIAGRINQTGDPALQIENIGTPVIKEQYRNIYLNLLAGSAIGFLIGTFITAISNYAKEGK